MFPLTLAACKRNLEIPIDDAESDILIEQYILFAWSRIVSMIGLPWTMNPPSKMAAQAITEAGLLMVNDAYEKRRVVEFQRSPTVDKMPLAVSRLEDLALEWRRVDTADPTPEEMDVSYQQVKNYLSDSRTITVQADDTREKITFHALDELVAARLVGWVSALPVTEADALGAGVGRSSVAAIVIPATSIPNSAYLWFWIAGDRILSSLQINTVGELLLDFTRSSLTVNGVDGTLYVNHRKLTVNLAGEQARVL